MSTRLFSQITTDDNNDNNNKGAIPLSKSEPDLVNGIPLSGEDYLLVVRKQASQCAKTVVAAPPKSIKKVSLPAHFNFFTSNEQNEQEQEQEQANQQWKSGYIETFKSYQKYKQSNKDKTKHHKNITSVEEAYKALYTESNHTIIPTFNQHTILRVLQYHIDWLNNTENIEAQFPCIFQLLLYLDPVLTSKNIAILRDLSRECIKLRSSKPPFIAQLNIIITIISLAFGQSDLV